MWQTMSSLEQVRYIIALSIDREVLNFIIQEFREKISQRAQVKTEEYVAESSSPKQTAQDAKPFSDNTDVVLSRKDPIVTQADTKETVVTVASPRSPSVANSTSDDFGSSTSAAAVDPALGGKKSLPVLSSVSRPHHIPKMDTLSRKLDEMRRNLGDEVGQLFTIDIYLI